MAAPASGGVRPCLHYRRIGCDRTVYGSSDYALQDVLVKAWSQHFERDGEPQSVCSFDFPKAVAALRELEQ